MDFTKKEWELIKNLLSHIATLNSVVYDSYEFENELKAILRKMEEGGIK